MLIERIFFNLVAFSLFIIIFFRMIKKNDTTYISILVLQAIGIAIAFIELIAKFYFGNIVRGLSYFLAILLPIVVLFVEKNWMDWSELSNTFLARMCLFFHDTKAAKKFLITLVEKHPESYLGHKMLAEIYEKEGGMRKAIDEYVMVIDIDKKDYDSYYKIAVLLNGLGKKEESIEMLENLVNKKPDYYMASELLGGLLCENENFKEAINVYMNALAYNPNNWDIYYNLGIAYTRLNDFNKAKECYQKAAELNSLLYNADYCLGEISLIFDDLEEAEMYFEKSLEAEEEVRAKSYYQLSRIHIVKDNKEQAVNYLNLAIELEPSYSKKALEDMAFMPIHRYIYQGEMVQKPAADIERKDVLEEKERKAQEHLENTYALVNKLSKNDIKKMHILKDHDIDLNQEQERGI